MYNKILVPVDAGIYSAVGLGQVQTTVEKVRRHLNHADLKITGLLITRAMEFSNGQATPASRR